MPAHRADPTERATRRANNNSSAALSGRRRRREPSASASRADGSQSDGAEGSDSSSLKRARTTRRSAMTQEPREDEEEDEEDEDEEKDEPEDGSSSSDKAPPPQAQQQQQRARSLSNVSTTSSTDSGVSEPLTEEARQARHGQKLAELEQKKKMVEDGTLAEYCRRVTEFKEDRNRLLQMAEWHKNLQLRNGKQLYEFELQRAVDLWQQGKQALKDDMAAKLDAVRDKLLKELEELSKADATLAPKARKPAPKIQQTRPKLATSTSQPTGENVGDQNASPSTLPANGEPAVERPKLELPEDMIRLSFDDISADLAAIAIDRKQRAEDSVAALPTEMDPVRLERRRLFCGKNIFQDGDEVVIASPVVKEDYVGKISSVTDDAVYIKLSSGQKVRIYLDLIKNKRCELKPLLQGLPALVEYESY